MTLIVGILAAVIILSGQVSNTQSVPTNVITQQADEDTEDQQKSVLKAVDAVATSAAVSITHQFYFITEIFLPQENHEESAQIELPKLSTFFTTLFRQIISPNAP